MRRISLAFRCFVSLLFRGRLSASLIAALGLTRRSASGAPPAPKPATEPPASAVRTTDGALQMLSILQRDARLVDFLMEDIASYSDDQVGAAVRELHDQCRDAIARYITLQPVIDGVEGTFTQAPSKDPNVVRFIGNVPAKPPSGGVLRHKGWRAGKIDLPALGAKQDVTVLAPAEIEIE
ncbi:MAG: DUF2760 domain-containing protein [Acidobacteriota bacterium]|nr:DUF2760 domain-containing protein [Acidobacteriota bacterium]